MTKSNIKRGVVLLALILLLVDAALVLWKIREAYFVSVPLVQFSVLAWGAIAGVITATATLVRVGSATWRTMRGVATEPEPFSIDSTIRSIYGLLKKVLTPLPASSAALVVLALGGYGLFRAGGDLGLRPAASSVIVEAKGPDKLIYVSDGARGEIRLSRSSELNKFTAIPTGTSGNVGERGAPGSMTSMEKDGALRLFVADTKVNKVFVVTGDTIIGSLSVGPGPRSLAITPDKRKLFVSNEQPIPAGTISVFDISESDPAKYVAAAPITGVNCPEGLALSPRGDFLYVATQCGGGKDPVFVIDTATHKIVASIPDLAVGTALAVDPDGNRLYVSRGNYPCLTSTDEKGSPLSIVDLTNRKILNTLCLRTSVGAVALSRDSAAKYLLVANGDWLTVFDRQSLDGVARRLNDIPLGASIAGFGVAADNSIFAYVPDKGMVFVYNPQGL